ncbi:MAG: RNA polymerase sporulation sigma factor SigK [Clostridia bacterium]|nr:RNA polymerase sporulation sigma factor SigK [Clostridia bacterium]
MLFESILYLISKLVFFTGSFLSNSSFPKPLDKNEENELIEKMQKGDKSAREKLINHNLRLVAHIVKKYAGATEQDDLISVGSIGLIKAIDTYNNEKGTGLATYTARCIENEILMMLRTNKKYKNEISMQTPVGKDKDGNELNIIDLLSDSEDSVFKSVDKEIESEKIYNFIKSSLTDREFKIICLRYGLKGGKCYAQREVASFLKISRSYISRIEKKAIEKLKEKGKNYNFYC